MILIIAKQQPTTFTTTTTVPILPQHITSHEHTLHPGIDATVVTSPEMSPDPPRYEDLDISYVSSSYSSSYKDSLTTTLESSSTSTDSEGDVLLIFIYYILIPVETLPSLSSF